MENRSEYRHDERSKTYGFGKIDLNKCGKAINEVELKVTLYYNKENLPVFTVVCTVWNSKKSDCELCGQCLDYPGIAANITKDYRLFLEIRKLWRKYRNNDIRNGSPKQYEALEKMTDSFKTDFYSKWPDNKPADIKWTTKEYACELAWLDTLGLKTDTYAGQEMTWGEKYYYWPIEPEDLERIKELVQ